MIARFTIALISSVMLAAPAIVSAQAPASVHLPDRPRPWPGVRADTLDLARGAGGSDLDAFILSRMATGRLPSIQACVVHDDQVIWAGAYGLASVDPPVPATLDTLYLIASNSKPVAATALMRLYDQGLFGLDDPIDDHVGFPVRHPDHAADPITPRMLLSHTAAVDDDWQGSLLDLVVPGDSPLPLGPFLADYLVPGGAYYNAAWSYLAGSRPGREFHYTNVGFTLATYLVEPLTGSGFATYCDEQLFTPLGMTDTGWFLADVDPGDVAMPYYYDDDADSYVAYGHTGWPAYPSACLRTTVTQQARILMTHMNGGRTGGVEVLQPLTAARMQAPQVSGALEYGFGLYRALGIDGRVLIGHDGYWWGNRTYMFFRPADDVGVVLFTNGDPIVGEHELEFAEILFRLFDEFDQTCPADLDDDGVVGFAEVLGVLRAWGPCEGCPEDVDYDGFVGVEDVLAVISGWGRCSFVTSTGVLGPVGSGVTPRHGFVNMPPAAGPVTIAVEAVADLGDASEAIDVLLGGVLIGTIFGDGANDCPETPDTTTLLLDAATFNDLAPDGIALLKLKSTIDVDPRQCDGFSYVTVRVEYEPAD